MADTLNGARVLKAARGWGKRTQCEQCTGTALESKLFPMNDLFLTEQEFSNHFKVPARTAQRWRSTGVGPPFVRSGPRRVAYRLSDVERWAAARTFASRAAELAKQSAAE